MNTTSILKRTRHALVGAGIAIFALAPAFAEDPARVTAHNYVRAETDFQMKGYIEKLDCFGKFTHSREPYDVDNQVTVRGNRDTLYSFGVFDLQSPLLVTLPDPKERYQSLMIVISGSFDLGSLRSQRRHSDRREGRHSVCVSGHSNLYGSER
jgi:hypothetical protein